MHSLIITEITALNPKCYSYIKATLEEMARAYPNLYKYYEDKKDKIFTDVNVKKGKGAPRVVIKNEIGYNEVIETNDPDKKKMLQEMAHLFFP